MERALPVTSASLEDAEMRQAVACSRSPSREPAAHERLHESTQDFQGRGPEGRSAPAVLRQAALSPVWYQRRWRLVNQPISAAMPTANPASSRPATQGGS